MKRYTPRHAAPGRLTALLAHFSARIDEPMSGFECALCGGFMGLLTGPLLILCYFG